MLRTRCFGANLKSIERSQNEINNITKVVIIIANFVGSCFFMLKIGIASSTSGRRHQKDEFEIYLFYMQLAFISCGLPSRSFC